MGCIPMETAVANERERIKRDVLNQLRWDSSVDTTDIRVEVRNSTVILTGTVPTLVARRAAYADALAIPGVTSVDNRLVVKHRQGRAATDEQIKSAIESMLLWSPEIDSARIKVSVMAGAVALEGTVDAEWQKAKAEDVASSVTGVVSVNNCLEALPLADSADRGIEDDVVAALSRISGDIRDMAIRVKVEKGVVTIAGTVPTWSMYIAVEDTVRYADGVVHIVNKLNVE